MSKTKKTKNKFAKSLTQKEFDALIDGGFVSRLEDLINDCKNFEDDMAKVFFSCFFTQSRLATLANRVQLYLEAFCAGYRLEHGYDVDEVKLTVNAIHVLDKRLAKLFDKVERDIDRLNMDKELRRSVSE